MKTFSIKTIGCKVNQYESQQVRQLLEGLGWSMASSLEESRLIVVNTCCVTQTASAKSRQFIHQAVKKNPQIPVVVCGCLAASKGSEIKDLQTPNIHLITNRNNLATTLSEINNKTFHPSKPSNLSLGTIKPENGAEFKNIYPILPNFSLLTSFSGQTRAFLKIQDGCDGYCSYCIIPKVRQKVYNKPPKEVLLEAQQLVKAGHKEIVVTGIFLGSYGQNTVLRKKWPNGQNEKLAELLEKMAKIPNLARIRLSSLEPADVTEKLLDCFCNNPNIMPHLHLSLQSGSDNVLKKMARQYRAKDFLKSVELIKNRLDRPAITCDLIAGFPGESDEDFQETVRVAKQIGFAKMHIFTYSARPGTAAARFRNPVEPKVIKERSKILRKLDAELGFQFRQQFIGHTDEMLTETAGDYCMGRSRRYFYIKFENFSRNFSRNQLVKIKLLQNTDKLMIGQPL